MCDHFKKVYFAAPYYRISTDDGKLDVSGKKESSSISSQRKLIEDYVKDKPDIILCEERIDDGFSGVNFERPAFKMMIEDIKAGRINCIIVKDLSRFARNYLEAGYYIEYIFPVFHVRFIAVTDGVDTLANTLAQSSYLIPLKNLINENYAADISKKERSAKKILRKEGCFIGAYAMYGYEKMQDKHKIRIDLEAADYVKMIFNLGEQGYSDSAIAKYLNQHKVLSPARYKYEKGILKHEKYAKTSRWYPQTVAGILSSRIYIGDMVQGKCASRQIRGKKEIVPQEAWDIVCGTHEAIISKEQFEQVQKIRQERHERYQKITNKKTVQMDKAKDKRLLKGKIYCGDCKKAMVRKYVKGGKDHWRYICEVYERTGTCSRKSLSEQELYQQLQSLVKRQIEVFCEYSLQEKRINLTENLLPAPTLEQRVKKPERRLRKNEKKQKELVRKKAWLYRQWKEGQIGREEYFYQKLCSEQEYQMAESAGKEKNRILASVPKKEKINKGEDLPGEWLEALIERIEVVEKSRIKVYFAFAALRE